MNLERTPKTAALLLALAVGASWAASARATTCTDLATATIKLGGHATVVSLTAVDVTGGSFTPPGGAPITGLPPFCAVSAVVSSSGDPATSQSAVEIWLPESGWNGRYLGLGNGGFAGSINYSTLELGLLEGFAAANTDMGTGILFRCNSLYCGNHQGYGGIPGGLYGDKAAIEDFGYAATHLMTVAAKQIVDLYYAKKPSYSYFSGCSTGGQQALMESQRFPNDYDGILAGAPAHNRTHLHLTGAAVYEATHFAPDADLTNGALAVAHTRVLNQCAGRDGGLRSDDFLTRPAMCPTNAVAVLCRGASGEIPCTDPASTSCTCLTRDQTTALNRDWDGAYDSRGRKMYPGAERGTEEPIALTPANGYVGNLGLPWQQSGTEPAFDSLMFWAFGPNWVWQELFTTPSAPAAPELAAEIAAFDNTRVGNSTFAGVLNANSTDLSAFAGHGGKMVMYQGYADPLIPSATSLDYVNAVDDADSSAENYLRLFMAPGMWHCSGGPGANSFGNLTNPPPQPLNPADDLLGALIAWVEHGVPPTRVIATKYVNDDPTQGIAFQRPLCLYPAYSEYEGGTTTSATSFACKPAPKVRNQGFSKFYGP
jgi:feruloyl esterase